ncbi:MAG: acyl carrier protein [Clostridiales Family XIII bacterium]|jgi:acyl carrier protein|nr:acyl carrier protein [Clostridiales Family XIII bacterium]
MKEKLIAELAEILETEQSELNTDTMFKVDEFEWDSLKGFAILIMIEETFGVEVSVDDFIEAKTVGDLIGLISK